MSKPIALHRAFSMPSKQDKANAKKVFDLIDKDGNGVIDPDEFQEFAKMPELYSKPKEAEKATSAAIRMAMRQVDQAQDSKISFDEFFEWWKGNVTVVGMPASIQENMKKLAQKK
eukprot:CAMPEP_0167802442 /NCGR_PEP_ID=MMETSP0111_2-20121227/19135_1 /TAXON_ID=91324 /ORGANISM="Lotharella globosa, Strain CCCM811" /LENGTH=114 /DNA_ID=CAMNT_0007698505 /DNA_START=46 /DNA_END=390 /DNA_ORIENTATION=-